MTFKDAASAVATLGNSDDEATKISVMNAIGAAMTSSADVSAHAEITLSEPLVAALLAAASDKKSSDVCAAASATLQTLATKAHDFVVGAAIIPATLAALDPKERWQTQVAAAEVLSKLSDCAPQAVASNMISILPVVTSMVNDAKKEVADATRKALERLCHTIDNRDVEPFISAMVEATIDHEKTDECVQKLASTTFVQTVTAAPLALISPILLLGFRARTTATKRMSAGIVNNMSKLVEDPEDAAPFLPNLLPAVSKASDQISDPEARTVCGKACEQLQSIEDRLKDASFKSKRAVFDVV